MHAAELVELAAMLAASGAALLSKEAAPPQASVERYWTASKCRHERWQRTLADHRALVEEQRRRPSGAEWRRLRPVVEEILSGEMLTRVWAAVLTAGDRIRGTDYGEPIGRSVLFGHLEARHRTLSLVIQGRGIEPQQAVVINRLRRRVERWTDLLVGHLATIDDVSEFAPSPKRALEFADDIRQGERSGTNRHAWPLTLTAIRAGLTRGYSGPSPNPDLNARIAAAILGALSSLAFDATGVPRSLWMLRVSTIADDTQGMIEDLLQADRPGEWLGDRHAR